MLINGSWNRWTVCEFVLLNLRDLGIDSSLWIGLANVRVTDEEIAFLKKQCPYFNHAYLRYLSTFQLKPSEQIDIKFRPVQDSGSDDDLGDIEYMVKGLWVETILYEIPLLALTSQAYFMFTDKDWDHSNQEEKAFRKGCTLLENGCIFSEFGSRRRRDYHTQDLVMQGLCRAAEEGKRQGWKGVFSGTSNVHFAMRYGVTPIGTVAHEWFMAIAAITDDYENANELALRYWLGCFGEGVRISSLLDDADKPLIIILGPRYCPHRYIRYPGFPRRLPQADPSPYQRRCRRRRHNCIGSEHNKRVAASD